MKLRQRTPVHSYANLLRHLHYAHNGSIQDLLWVAEAYFYGLYGCTRNQGASFSYYLQAYVLGERDGVAQLAYLYDEGIGVPKNEPLATSLYYEALPQSGPEVYHNLGLNLVDRRKYTEAQRMFQYASDRGSMDSQVNLAWIQQIHP
jgi:TPR repeat protein